MKFLILLSCVVYVYSCGIPGSYCPIDADGLEVKKIANFAVAKYVKTNSSLLAADANPTVAVKSVSTQVVAGLNYKMDVEITAGDTVLMCNFVVYNRWDGIKSLSSSDCKPKTTRQFLAGGVSNADPNDPEVKAAMNYAVDQINMRSNGLYKMLLISDTHCSKQVVAGMKYTCTLSLGESTCTTYMTDLSNCAVKSDGMRSEWHVSIVSQPWMNPKYTVVALDKTSEGVVKQEPSKPKPVKTKQPIRFNKLPNLEDKLNDLTDNSLQNDVNKLLHGSVQQPLKELMNGLRRIGARQQIANLLADSGLKLKKSSKSSILGNIVEEAENQIKALGNKRKVVKPIEDKIKLFMDKGIIPDEKAKKSLSLKSKNLNAVKMNENANVTHKQLLGKDGHDLQPHGNSKNLIGGDGHDLQPHGNSKNLIGGDGHDLQHHGSSKNLIGRDGHDLKPHGSSRNLIGGDGHDLQPHGSSKNLIGGDGHDLKPHGSSRNLIGGDGHDLQPHGNNKNLIGGDGHDLQPHGSSKNLIGGDGHDLKPHGSSKNLIGGDGHDLQPHGNSKNIIGGDGHDLCHYGTFSEFKTRHGRKYSTVADDKERFGIFCDNMKKARELQKYEQGSARYGATKFADMTESEFKKYVGKPWDLNGNAGMKKALIPDVRKTPAAFDWRERDAVTPVKNQGSCGSCWAFSTTGNIEGQWSIKHGKLISLSEQELVDCDKLDEGCNGGLPSNAYKEIIRLGGLETESEYKYKGVDEKCFFNKSEAVVNINSSVSISSNETEMAAWLAANGPISIGINAFAMQFYMGGISHPWKIFCNPKSLDHGVLIVGYGTQNSEPYWIVKNSWGPDWGEKGYYLVYRGDGVCGLNTMCTSAVVN